MKPYQKMIYERGRERDKGKKYDKYMCVKY